MTTMFCQHVTCKVCACNAEQTTAKIGISWYENHKITPKTMLFDTYVMLYSVLRGFVSESCVFVRCHSNTKNAMILVFHRKMKLPLAKHVGTLTGE